MTLSDYLDKTKQTQTEFAKKLGKSQQLVSGYCTGALIAPRDTALKIVEISNGAVTLEDLWHMKKSA
jgi:DNA-binding transcriptional regulator YdaS (Cro superfamily)